MKIVRLVCDNRPERQYLKNIPLCLLYCGQIDVMLSETYQFLIKYDLICVNDTVDIIYSTGVNVMIYSAITLGRMLSVCFPNTNVVYIFETV